MDHKKSFIKGALSGALIMLLIVILGSGVWKAATVRMAGGEAEAAQISAESETDKKLNMLSNVIDQYYLYGDDIDEKAMQDGIYKGYASGLGDPYTVYYNEEQTRDLLDSTTGEYSGIGAMMQQNYQTRQVTIGNIYKNSPAEEAGLKTGDILYQVDDHVIDQEDLSEIVSWIKGEEGTEVDLHVYRGENAEKVVCTATRRKIETQTVEYEMKEDQIGYLRIL